MSQFPAGLDSDTDLPRVDNNITDIGADAMNALRDAMFAVEANIGVNAQGSAASIAARFNTSHDPAGRILPSALTGLGLVYLPITDSEISATAGIEESKLNLVYPTTTLYSLYQNLKNSVDVLNGFLSLTGIKLEPHIDGTDFKHELSHILVDATLQMLKTLPGANIILPGTSVQNRNTANADILIKDISDDLLTHEKSNGNTSVTALSGGLVPPQGFAHVASGLYIDTSSFAVIPQSMNSLQSFAQFVDSSSLLLIGGRTQNLFSNGISAAARASSLTADGYGQSIVPPTPIIAYLLNVPPGPIATGPIDDIGHGDDVVLFQPTSQQLSSFNIDAQFAQVRAGDQITINYGNGITAQFTIDSVKSIVSGNNRTYAVRLNGKNLYSTSSGMAQIDRPLYSTNKYGVLAPARCPNNIGVLESLIIAHPRAAMVLGNGFNPSQFDSTHYNLYLTLFPNGDPTAPLPMPAVDVTGNQGATPGEYTLDTIVDNVNTAFRAPGFNLRFIAFQYQGQFGIMLAESYNNAAFSIVSGTVNNLGNYTPTSLSSYPNNVVDNYGTGVYPIDPLGFGLTGANIASPPPSNSYASVSAAQFAPSLLFYPKRKRYYYVNGVETDLLKSDPLSINQIEDTYGDGYWPATILASPATMILSNRVQVTYQVNLDLSTSGIKAGKSIVVQPAFPTTDARYNFRDYGRFVIQSVSFSGCDTSNPITNIVVYDGVHANGSSPTVTSTNIPVNIYFSDDSVGFNIENIADQSSAGLPYKRFFEIYVDQVGRVFSHERARFTVPATGISNVSFYDVSPKLQGYSTQIAAGEFGQAIQLNINSYDSTTGLFTGQLVNPNAPLTNYGPLTTGKKGDIVRFYDETNLDYIEFKFDPNTAISSWSSQLSITIQVFPSLELDQEKFLIAGCQVNDITGKISYLTDKREFGNTSEHNFTSSAIDYIAAPTRLLNENGIIRGFDQLSISGNMVQFDGGEAVINGRITQLNPQTVEIPAILEAVGGLTSNSVKTITWFVCVNQNAELQLVASTDFDPNGSFASQYVGFDNTRLFYGMNPNLATPVAYPIRGTYFSDLVLNQTDLVPVAIAVATVTESGGTYSVSTLTCSDARRFVYRGYGGLSNALVLGNNASFRSFTSLTNWITQLNNLVSATNTTTNSVGSRILVKGDITISSTVTINSLKPVTFIGDGGIINVTVAKGLSISNNICFENVRFDYNFTPGGAPYSSTNLVNSSNAAIYCAVSSSVSNVAIKNCIFNSYAADRYPFISFEFTGNQAELQNLILIDNQFINNTTTHDLRAAIVFNSISKSLASSFPYFPKMIDCAIEHNFCNDDQMIVITAPRTGIVLAPPFIACTNVRIAKNICGTIGFITSYDIPSIQSNVTTGGLVHDKGENLQIYGNTCKYITNLDATGQYVGFATYVSATANTSLPWAPATFAITNATNTSPIQITATLPSASNANAFTTGLTVTVKGVTGNTNANVYGAAITVISSTSTSITFSLNGTTGNGTYSGGGYVYVVFNTITNGTGRCVIDNNVCSWIHVGNYSDTNGSGRTSIMNNKMSPYVSSFLANYTDTTCNVTPINAAIVLNDDSGSGTTYSRIAYNTMLAKTNWSGTAYQAFTYDQGIICLSNADIDNNNINSCVTSSPTNTYIVFPSIGPTINIKNNVLSRGGSSILAYVGTAYPITTNTTFLGQYKTSVSITHNKFDSTYVDAANTITNDTNTFINDSWEYNYNINQILHAAIPMYELYSGSLSNIVPGKASGEPLVTGFNIPVSINSNIQYSNTSGIWYGVVDAAKYIPTGATMLYIILGISTDTGNANNFTGTGGQINLAAVKQYTSAVNLSSLANSLADINGTSNSSIYTFLPSSAQYLLNSSTQINNLYGTTQYLKLDLTTAAQNFCIGKDNEIKLIFQSYGLTVSANNVYLDTSPIIIRYTFK